MKKPILNGLWRDQPDTPEGKYLVKRRDGTLPEWPSFTLGAKDPCAPNALRAYAAKAKKLGLPSGYFMAVYKLANEFDDYRSRYGTGDPECGPHRKDDPDTIAEMRKGKST
jgi:hypothetical protein